MGEEKPGLDPREGGGELVGVAGLLVGCCILCGEGKWKGKGGRVGATRCDFQDRDLKEPALVVVVEVRGKRGAEAPVCRLRELTYRHGVGWQCTETASAERSISARFVYHL